MNAPDAIALDGAVENLPAELYHRHEAMSASGGKKILRSPMHFRLSRDQPSAPTEQMQFGTAVHAGVLEPDTFAERVVCAPEVNKRTNAGKAEWSTFCIANAGRIVLEREDFDRCRGCVDAVQAHPTARELLTGATVELSLFWQDGRYGVPCKSRFDALNHGGIPDLKTCIDASRDGFARAIGAFQYHLQAAFYFSASEHVLHRTPDFFCFICVESQPPHAVAVYELDRPSLLAGMNLCDEALTRYRACLESGRWPGYSPLIERINAPRWALRDFY